MNGHISDVNPREFLTTLSKAAPPPTHHAPKLLSFLNTISPPVQLLDYLLGLTGTCGFLPIIKQDFEGWRHCMSRSLGICLSNEYINLQFYFWK